MLSAGSSRLGDTEAGGTGATHFAIARYGTAPVLRVDPNTELNPAGSAPVINGWGFPPSATLSLQQCNGGTCAAIGSPSTDTTGHFTASSATVSYALPGEAAPQPVASWWSSGTGFTPAEAPISFAASTSIAVTPSRGGILQGDAIKVGDVDHGEGRPERRGRGCADRLGELLLVRPRRVAGHLRRRGDRARNARAHRVRRKRGDRHLLLGQLRRARPLLLPRGLRRRRPAPRRPRTPARPPASRCARLPAPAPSRSTTSTAARPATRSPTAAPG